VSGKVRENEFCKVVGTLCIAHDSFVLVVAANAMESVIYLSAL